MAELTALRASLSHHMYKYLLGEAARIRWLQSRLLRFALLGANLPTPYQVVHRGRWFQTSAFALRVCVSILILFCSVLSISSCPNAFGSSSSFRTDRSAFVTSFLLA